MGAAAAFKATYAGLRSLADGDFRISFDFPGHEMRAVLEVLTQGGMPSAAKGDWFAIARLNIGGAAAHDGRLTTPPGHNASLHGSSAQGLVTKTSPGRSLSQHVYKLICLEPRGRAFIEEFFQDILQGQKANDAEVAKDAIRRRLGISSLSEIDSDPVASEQAEQLLNLFAGWERGYAKAER